MDLVYLRVSQINGCAYCIDKHTRDLIKGGASIEKLALVQVWAEAGSLFSEREKAALHWVETVTWVAQTHIPEADFTAADPFQRKGTRRSHNRDRAYEHL